MFKKMLKSTVLIFLAVLIIFAISQILSQSPQAVLKKLIMKNCLGSNKLNIQLNYLWFIPVGQASLDNLGKERFRGEDLIHLRAEAKTFDFVRNIFYAHATVDSYIDPRGMFSRYFLQHLVMINKKDDNRELSYDQRKHVMTYIGPRGKEDRVIEENAQDPLSAIFLIENKEFKIGDDFQVSLNSNQKNYILFVNVVSNQIVRIADKDYVIWLTKSRIQRKGKNPYHKTSYRIWFLNYNNKNMPILIKASTNIGPIVAKAQ